MEASSVEQSPPSLLWGVLQKRDGFGEGGQAEVDVTRTLPNQRELGPSQTSGLGRQTSVVDKRQAAAQALVDGSGLGVDVGERQLDAGDQIGVDRDPSRRVQLLTGSREVPRADSLHSAMVQVDGGRHCSIIACRARPAVQREVRRRYS